MIYLQAVTIFSSTFSNTRLSVSEQNIIGIKLLFKEKEKKNCSTNQFDRHINTHTTGTITITRNRFVAAYQIESNRIESSDRMAIAQINSKHKFILCPFRNVRANKTNKCKIKKNTNKEKRRNEHG